jgi:hypothetical protein
MILAFKLIPIVLIHGQHQNPSRSTHLDRLILSLENPVLDLTSLLPLRMSRSADSHGVGAATE